MKQTEFGALLDEMLKQLPYSKNEVIVRTGINRSTFYQFLNGKRFPTAKHMAAILGKAGFSEEDRTVLEDAWEKAGAQYGTYSALQSMLSCMDAISETESMGKMGGRVGTGFPERAGAEDAAARMRTASGSIEVFSMIGDFIRKQAASGQEGKISAFLPWNVLHMLEQVPHVFDSAFGGQLICQFPEEAGKSTRFAADSFQKVLPLVMNTGCSVHAYYDDSNIAHQTGLLYPYYVIGKDRVLFVSAAADRALEYRDSLLVKEWKQAFSGMLPYAQEITLRGITLRDVHERVLQALIPGSRPERQGVSGEACPECRENGSRKLYILGHAPCMSTMATENLIRQFVPKEARPGISAYCMAVQQCGTVEVVSAEGLRSLAEKGAMEEWGIRAAVPEEDLLEVFQRLKMRLGKTLFIADKSCIEIPESWVVYIIPEHSLTLIPNESQSALVSVDEPNVQNAFFTSVQESLDYFVLKQEKAAKILDECMKIIRCR